MKLFVYNFGGEIYESNEAFDDTCRAKLRQARANGEPITRQVIDGDKVSNQRYHPAGIFLDED
jgi:hypothetical protein